MMRDEYISPIVVGVCSVVASIVVYILIDGAMMTDKAVPFSKRKPAEKFWMKLELFFPSSAAACVSQFSTGSEYQFDEDRKWRFDFCWPEQMLAVEIDGFGYGHQAQQCMAEDNEKQNAAIEMGWKVLRYNTRQVQTHDGAEFAAEQTVRMLCNSEVVE